MSEAALLVEVVRDGVVESVHHGHVVIAEPDGRCLASIGDPELPTYVRSAAKPFQALATMQLTGDAGVALDTDGLAIACASHTASDVHQVEAARLLALADLDESALACPPALPADLPTLLDQREPTALAHNCSGKHAAFLLAQVCDGADPRRYLDPEGRLQVLVRERLAEVTATATTGPGVDGCGAPAWLVALRGLAVGFARLAAGSAELAAVRAAMTARPDLVGGAGCVDTALMLADARVVAKRGAEAVLASGWSGPGGPVGIAVKIADGGQRATGPVMARVLETLGAGVPQLVAAPAVLGGGRPHGLLRTAAPVRSLARH